MFSTADLASKSNDNEMKTLNLSIDEKLICSNTIFVGRFMLLANLSCLIGHLDCIIHTFKLSLRNKLNTACGMWHAVTNK